MSRIFIKRYLIPLISVVVLILSFALPNIYGKTADSETTHIHAAFHVYQNGELKDFSGDEYMHFEPCGDQDVEGDEEHDQTERGHLHDNVGDVVHVHRDGTTWDDLFTNLGFSFDNDVTAYIDGELVDTIFDTDISDESRVLFIDGEADDVEEKFDRLPTVERIQEVAQQEESCTSE